MLWQPSLPEKYLKASPDELAAGITARRQELGDQLVILGHHYQTDEIIRHADYTGDSLKLSQIAARLAEERPADRPVKWVIFCGVHFMAESADMLTPEPVEVILPDLSAGCSMADMAQYDDTVEAWNAIHAELNRQHGGRWTGRVIPITYVNSSAAIKAFVGQHGGACCTSSNADLVFDWAMRGGGGTPLRGVHASKGLQPTPPELDHDSRPHLKPKDFVGRDPFPKGDHSPLDLVRQERNLPHIELPGATYFVTWKTLRDQPLSAEEMQLVLHALTHWDGERCRVYAANVMNTHVHWIVRPFDGQSLTDLIASVKRFSATQINKLRRSHGHVWLDESFDHVVRHQADLDNFLRYLIRNPVEAGLVSKPSEYSWTRVHPDLGWMRGGELSHASERRATTEPTDHEDIRILFLPDQHLGRNTAAKYGIDVRAQTCLYDPRLARKGEPFGGATPEQLAASKVILWAGHCSVHKLFRPEHCDQIRADDAAHPERPATTIIVHPECAKEVVDKADLSGSTEFIIKTLSAASPGSRWAIGTETHLVNRLCREAAARGVDARILSDCQCLCTTMYRIDQPHLLWVLDNLAGAYSKDGRSPKVVNSIRVHPQVRELALQALDRMLSLARPAVATVD